MKSNYLLSSFTVFFISSLILQGYSQAIKTTQEDSRTNDNNEKLTLKLHNNQIEILAYPFGIIDISTTIIDIRSGNVVYRKYGSEESSKEIIINISDLEPGIFYIRLVYKEITAPQAFQESDSNISQIPKQLVESFIIRP